MNDIRLDGKVAIVTGAGRGLGRSHALLLASRGAAVIVNDLGGPEEGAELSPAQEVVQEIVAAGGSATVDDTDISTLEGATKAVELAVTTYGRIDILVNNAGILRDKTMAKLTVGEVDQVFQVHLGGTIWMTKAAWPHFIEQGSGAVINTTSAAGLFGNFGQTNYAGAKAGIIGITKTLAIEGQRAGIKVNAIEPGARTRMTENLLGDLADSLDPSLVSPLVLWLASDECETSGDVYNAGGGRVARVLVSQTPGFFSRTLSAEDLRDNWDSINDVSTAEVLLDFKQEMDILISLLSQNAGS